MPKHFWALIAVAFGLTAAAGLAAPRFAHADALPDPEVVAGDGRNVSPVDVTNVQMVSETVVLDVQTLPFPFDYDPEYKRLGAAVAVDFLFHNPGAGTENLNVGFPLFLSTNNRGDTYPEILELRAWVNGAEAAVQEQKINGARWSIWPMSFPPGDTALRVTYHSFALSARFWPTVSLKYLLYTGSAWAGPIGQADLSVRFPFPIEEAMLAPKRTLSGYQLSQFELRWRRENFEPTQADDLVVTFVQPEAWRDVLRARQQVAADPSAASYRALGDAYAILVRDCDLLDPEADYSLCSQIIGQLAEAQYRKAVELAPDDDALRQVYIEFVNRNAGVNLPSGSVPILPTVVVPTAPAPSPTLASATATPSPTLSPAGPTTPQPSSRPVDRSPEPTSVAAVTSAARESPVPLTPTSTPPTAAPPETPWGTMAFFLVAFAVVVGGILFLRRHAAS